MFVMCLQFNLCPVVTISVLFYLSEITFLTEIFFDLYGIDGQRQR